MSDIAVKVEGLGKQYRLGQRREPYGTLRDTLVNAARAPFRRLRGSAARREAETIWALRDVSLEVRAGEVVGIIGRNGAGKSTLLKVLTRITEPTTGYAELHGRAGALLEVGTGFHPELSGRENIYLNGAILGMHKSEIDRKFDEIVAFAEIEKFLDTPVKRYSSGMYVRLAFAVAAHLEPEILLVDEVLAVGDIGFQKKCLGKMGEVAREGRTVLLVSHNMGAIGQLCPNCVWLEKGAIKDFGPTAPIVGGYLRSQDASEGSGEATFPEDRRKEGQLRAVRVLNQAGERTQRFSCDEPVVVELTWQVHRRVPGMYGYLQIGRMDGTTVLVSDSLDTVPNPLDDLPAGLHTLCITVPPRTLGPADYTLYLNFASRSAESFDIDTPGIVCNFSLEDMTSRRGNARGGYFSLLLPWTVQESSWRKIE